MGRPYPAGLAVTTEPAIREQFALDEDCAQGILPRAVALPESILEVQSLIKWANRSGAKILPVSSTRPRRRGDTVPKAPDVVIADLSGMDRLVHADERDKIAIIEPGVNFGAIDQMLAPHGLRALRPLRPRAGKSVLASYLDREPLINPNDHWDSADPFGGTAIVLGNGDLALTGSAGIEGTLRQQLENGSRHMVASGPGHTDLLRVVQGSQGTLGTMVWGAVYCERIPAIEESCFVTADSLGPVLALARDLLLRRITSSLFVVDSTHLALLMLRERQEARDLAARLPQWTLFVSQSGASLRPRQKLEWQVRDLHACATLHGCKVQPELAEVAADQFAVSLRTAIPGDYRNRATGRHRELFFQQTFSGIPAVMEARASVMHGSHWPVGTYIQPMAQGTYCHVEMVLAHTAHQAAVVEPFWRDLIDACTGAGAFFSRPYGAWKQQAFERDATVSTMMSAAKHLMDPNHVMHPSHLPYEGSN